MTKRGGTMGRQYRGLDYRKVTVRLNEKQFDIVRHYGWKQQERVYAEQDRIGKPKPYSWKMSDVIHDAINLLGRYLELSDNMETSAANLIDIATVFDKIDGEAAQAYAQAIRQAAALLLVFCENAEFGLEDGKLIFRAISQTKRNKYHETEIVISSADGEPLDHQISQDRRKGPSEALQGPSEGLVVSLPSEAYKCAVDAFEAAGEGLPDFAARALTIQAQRDAAARKLVGGK